MGIDPKWYWNSLGETNKMTVATEACIQSIVVLRSQDGRQRMERIEEAKLESTVVGPQQCDWGLTMIPLEKGRLLIGTEGADNVQMSHADRELCVFLFNMRGTTHVNGQEVSRRQCVCIGPGVECCTRLSAGTRWAAYAISSERLRRRLQTLEMKFPASATDHLTIYVPPIDVIENLHGVLRNAHEAAEQPQLLATRASRQVMEEALLAGIVRTLGEPLGPYRRNVAQGRLFRRAHEYLHSHEEAVSITEVCKALGIGARSLFYAFQEYTGMSPARFMRARRLNLVRRQLQAVKRTDATVTAAATRYGFFELGRFAVSYRALFGESPGQTLQTKTL